MPIISKGAIGGGGSSTIGWTALVLADATLTGDPNSLVGSAVQSGDEWALTSIDSGSADDDLREGWYREFAASALLDPAGNAYSDSYEPALLQLRMTISVHPSDNCGLYVGMSAGDTSFSGAPDLVAAGMGYNHATLREPWFKSAYSTAPVEYTGDASGERIMQTFGQTSLPTGKLQRRSLNFHNGSAWSDASLGGSTQEFAPLFISVVVYRPTGAASPTAESLTAKFEYQVSPWPGDAP